VSFFVVALVAVLVVVVIVIVARRRRTPDTVASFQRQIDALSAEARRPVVDQVTQLERDDEPPERPAADIDDEADDEADDDGESTPEEDHPHDGS
jgi:hypothetical protein